MKIPFDLDRAIELVKLGASDAEVVSILGVEKKELTPARLKELHRYRAERSVRLKAKLYELALKGNAQALLRLMKESDEKQPKTKKGRTP